MTSRSRIFTIGDVHGCRDALAGLLALIAPRVDDTVVMLGDYVDRGPDSAGVIDLLLEWSQRCRMIFLRGNHEIMMLNSRTSSEQLHFWRECGGAETMQSYGGSLTKVPDVHWDFLSATIPYFETDQFFFVHANYQYDLPLEDQPPLFLYWEHLRPLAPRPHENGKQAFVGHTPQKDGVPGDYGHLVAVDTFCVGGGMLTAVECNLLDCYQVDRDGGSPMTFPLR
ncbi:serine/threonine protein phosphatase [Blastopirellula sp. JC732]|uniref:Serine/threonine protein phosphatase n=1 Tax=Blastopirellula sediminis TaxID=2894196 RepID=A0A9X1MRK2_9BACT|nr:metallophosphoesterase family protein [Blastopirellula sediminis]MCC9604623.1 serine/threonine protein phosphatase [Blastopirellula sediminis]MCC9632078.1 serine/threonine protein phosphatase [Blastopirellula sediminis]